MGMPKTHNLKNGAARPEGFEHYLTVAEACRRLGVNRRTFDRYQAAGEIEERWKDGTQYFFEPSTIDSLAELKADENAQNALDQPTAALLGQAYAHNERLLTQLLEAQERTMNMQDKVLERTFSRIERLEQTHAELIEAREEALDQSHERQVAMQEALSAQQRKDQALAWLKEVSPKLLDAYLAKKNPAALFLNTLTPEQVELALMLGKDGLWSEQQLAMLQQIQKDMLAKQAQSTDNPEPGEKTESTE